jgi:putative membrane protein
MYIGAAVNLLILSAVVFLIAKLLPAIRVKSFATAVVVALIYSVINILLDLLLRHVSLPVILKEAYVIGLIRILINAVLLWVTDMLVKDFKIKNFGWTLVASLLITIACWLVKWLVTAFIPGGGKWIGN